MKRLSIAYYSVNDPRDKRSWSGITHYLSQGLQRKVGDVTYLGPVQPPRWLDLLLRATAKFTRLVFRKEYNTKHNLLFGWYAARVLKARMKGKHFDCIVAPGAATEFSALRTTLPRIYTSDTTFELISNYYLREYARISRLSRWEGNLIEKRALHNANFVIVSSNWARNSAIGYYGVEGSKVVVQPLGANMDHDPGREMIFEKEKNPVLTLLYLAVEWERKGGPVAFAALEELHRRGVPARLIVCGCIPPETFRHPGMEVIPFLNKNINEDHDRFVHLLSTSHFLLLPTRADCSLLVACESNAYGMPAIATQTGGVPDVVRDGINGYCLPYDAPGAAYAELIQEIFSDKDRYHELIRTARQEYEQRLTWDRWAERFAALYEEHVLGKGGSETQADASSSATVQNSTR